MKRRNAISVLELTVALVLLGVTVSLVGQFVANVNQGLRDRELSSQLGWEIENARERICSWPAAEVTLENITAIPISNALVSRLPGARWRAEVVAAELPLAATQVTLFLDCELDAQQATPQQLTFWVAAGGGDDD